MLRVPFLGWAAARARRVQQRGILRLCSQALTPQASVHAVQWNGEEFLLGCTGQQVTLLARRSAPEATGERT
jgi:flagellar biogenesis protein FliO